MRCDKMKTLSKTYRYFINWMVIFSLIIPSSPFAYTDEQLKPVIIEMPDGTTCVGSALGCGAMEPGEQGQGNGVSDEQIQSMMNDLEREQAERVREIETRIERETQEMMERIRREVEAKIAGDLERQMNQRTNIEKEIEERTKQLNAELSRELSTELGEISTELAKNVHAIIGGIESSVRNMIVNSEGANWRSEVQVQELTKKLEAKAYNLAVKSMEKLFAKSQETFQANINELISSVGHAEPFLESDVAAPSIWGERVDYRHDNTEDTIRQAMSSSFSDKELALIDELNNSQRIKNSHKYQFKSPKGDFLTKNRDLYQRLYSSSPYHEQGIRAREIGLTAVQVADQEFASGRNEEAEVAHQIGQNMLDISLGLVPYVGVGKDAFEAVSGKNFVTGATLSSFERSMAVVGLGIAFVTAGTLSSGAIKAPVKIIGNILKKIHAESLAKGLVWVKGGFASVLKGADRIASLMEKIGLEFANEVDMALDYFKRTLGNDIGAIGDLSEFVKGKMIRYGPLKPGPLHKIKVGTETVADTFRSSSYFETVLEEPLKVFRVYGGDAGELGSYWSRVKPTGPAQATFDAALLPNFRNSARKVAEVTIPAGTRIFEGVASSQTIRSAGFNIKIGELLGNGSQVYINEMIDKGTWKFISREFFE